VRRLRLPQRHQVHPRGTASAYTRTSLAARRLSRNYGNGIRAALR
jgi:hypothetical protein